MIIVTNGLLRKVACFRRLLLNLKFTLKVVKQQTVNPGESGGFVTLSFLVNRAVSLAVSGFAMKRRYVFFV